jgi:hypothetical protein
MSTLTIRHTYEDGTTVLGTVHGDSAYPILRGVFGMRFERDPEPGVWQMSYSRGKLPDEERIEKLEDALRAAGFDVELDLDRGLAVLVAGADKQEENR